MLLSVDTVWCVCLCVCVCVNGCLWVHNCAHTCGTRATKHVKSNRHHLGCICKLAKIGLHSHCASRSNSSCAFQSHYTVQKILTFPGSSLERGTLRKHLFKDRLCRIEFCRERQKESKREGERGRRRKGGGKETGQRNS